MKNLTVIIILLVTALGVSAANPISAILKSDKSSSRWQEARKQLLDGSVDEAIQLYAFEIEFEKGKRTQGSQVSVELLSEYAYALALAQAQPQALEFIDIAVSMQSNTVVAPFYIYSVLYVTGHKGIVDTLSGVSFEKWCSQAPAWIRDRAVGLNSSYASSSSISFADAQSGIREISSLLAQDRKIEALAYGTVFTKEFPDDQMGYLLESSAWEKLDCFSSASECFDKAYSLASVTGSLMNAESLRKQKDFLQKKSGKKGNLPTFINRLSAYVYGGIGYSGKSFNIQGRYGVVNGPVSLAFDVSLFVPDKGKTIYSYGATGYYRWKKLVTGLGLSMYDNDFSFTPTVGLSFLNSKGTSSFDIMLTTYVPTSRGADVSINISVGKTFYFKL